MVIEIQLRLFVLLIPHNELRRLLIFLAGHVQWAKSVLHLAYIFSLLLLSGIRFPGISFSLPLLLLLIDSPERTLVSAHRAKALNLNVLDRVGSALHVLLDWNEESVLLLSSRQLEDGELRCWFLGEYAGWFY
jgi:hypothetical protein